MVVNDLQTESVVPVQSKLSGIIQVQDMEPLPNADLIALVWEDRNIGLFDHSKKEMVWEGIVSKDCNKITAIATVEKGMFVLDHEGNLWKVTAKL